MQVLTSLKDIRAEAAYVKSLYHENPTGCYFLTGHKILESKDNVRGAYRAPVVELRDWSYDDLFELIRLNMNVAEQEIEDLIEFLKEIRFSGEWRPLFIGPAFVVFESLTQDRLQRKQIGALVRRFQKLHGFEANPTEWGAYWIGQQ